MAKTQAEVVDEALRAVLRSMARRAAKARWKGKTPEERRQATEKARRAKAEKRLSESLTVRAQSG